MSRENRPNYDVLKLAVLVAVRRCEPPSASATHVMAYSVLGHTFPSGPRENWPKHEASYMRWAENEVEDADFMRELPSPKALQSGIYRLTIILVADGDGDSHYDVVAMRPVDGIPWPGWDADSLELIERYEAARDKTYQGCCADSHRWDEVDRPAHQEAFERGIYLSHDPHHGPVSRETAERTAKDEAIAAEGLAEIARLRNLPGDVATVRSRAERSTYGPTACVRCGAVSAFYVTPSATGGPRRLPSFGRYACRVHLADVIPVDPTVGTLVEPLEWTPDNEAPIPCLDEYQAWVACPDSHNHDPLVDQAELRFVLDLTDDAVTFSAASQGGNVTLQRWEWWRWVRNANAKLIVGEPGASTPMCDFQDPDPNGWYFIREPEANRKLQRLRASGIAVHPSTTVEQVLAMPEPAATQEDTP